MKALSDFIKAIAGIFLVFILFVIIVAICAGDYKKLHFEPVIICILIYNTPDAIKSIINLYK